MSQEHTLVVAPFYRGWDVYQQLLVKALTPLTPEQLDLKVAPHLRSVGTIARHIIGARARWLLYVLNEGSQEELTPVSNFDMPDQPARTAAELVSGLEATWQAIAAGLQHWTPADLEGEVVDIDDEGQREVFTRQWVIWHLIEHDLHHGGEISFALGIHGLTAIDI